jgi:hypothetical protein
MAKNFTDFQQITGAYVAPSQIDGVTIGTTDTQATTDMHLVGYELDSPHGERRYTIESVLLAAQPYHVGLENVTNESREYMFNNSNLTGTTSADNLIILGDLVVEGDSVTMNTTIASTSALSLRSFSPSNNVIALEVQQYGPGPIARFLDGENLAVDISADGNVGIKTLASSDTTLTVLGDVSAAGEVYTTGALNGRYLQQDGAKLDNIQPWSDVTGLNLSNVHDRMVWLAANTTEHADITPAKGFDLLEDGEQFNKTPALSSVISPGIGDYSTQKIASIEYQADVTRDHSADIILNDIPDGPWTGSTGTTYVKVTSADRDRLTSVRGVDTPLYVGDDGEDLTPQHIVQAYQSEYADYWSSSDEIEYRDVIIPKTEASYNAVTQTSGAWNSTYITVSDLSANWYNTHSSVNTSSADWEYAHQQIINGQDKWNSAHSSVLETSAGWDSTYTSVLDTSADWNYAYAQVTAGEAKWDSTYTSVETNSAEWSSSVNNKLNGDGSQQSLPAGEAELTKVSITEGLTAQFDVKLGGSVHVLSGGEWKPGVTASIDVGGDKLVFVDGILVDWVQ